MVDILDVEFGIDLDFCVDFLSLRELESTASSWWVFFGVFFCRGIVGLLGWIASLPFGQHV